MKKILIVEDDLDQQIRYARRLGDKVNIISAYTVRDGERLFNENQDIDLIVMDACVPGDHPTTPPLVIKIRQTFSGPMIAASSDADYRQELMACGCDHQAKKYNVPEKVIEILGI